MTISVSCRGEKALAETGGTDPHFPRASHPTASALAILFYSITCITITLHAYRKINIY